MKQQRPIRESVTTIKRDGSRLFLHPSDVSGRFTTARRLFAFLLIAIYASLPWIPVGGHPAVFLDVMEGRFHLFGLTFAAQDLWMTFFFITGLGFSLFFLTALFGRLWCGWACPHTVFLEHVYRRVERWIEGDAPQRKKLDEAPWTGGKIAKRVLKHGIFVFISFLIAHLFLAYFVSIPQLYEWMRGNPAEHLRAFFFMVIATGVLYFNFSWFREQLCLVICPYGRLQSALIDDDSVVIGYDENRGEPRGPAKKEGFGDCINCYRCVQVCPTGIDIRQGLQMECVGCANCIDACDAIMTKLGRPTGLVRYDSQAGLEGKPRKFLRPRIFLYFALMLLGAAAFTFSATRLTSANMNAVRMTGAPYIVDSAGVRNQYMVRIINKSDQTRVFSISALKSPEAPAFSINGNENISVPPMGEEVRPLILSVARTDYQGDFEVTLQLNEGDRKQIVERKVEFLGPDPRLLQP